MPAWDVNAEITIGPFDANGHYVGLTRSLKNPVFASGYTGSGFLAPANRPINLGSNSTVWGLEAGLTFPVMAHQSRVALGYQRTTQLPTILPEKRYYADYMVNFAKWFDMGLAVFQDRDYNIGEGAIITPAVIGAQPIPAIVRHAGATGNKSTVGQLRFSVKFA